MWGSLRQQVLILLLFVTYSLSGIMLTSCCNQYEVYLELHFVI